MVLKRNDSAAMRQKLIKARGMGLKGIAIPASIMLEQDHFFITHYKCSSVPHRADFAFLSVPY